MDSGSMQSIVYLFACTILLSISLVISLKYQQARKPTKIFLAGYFWSYFLSAVITYIVLTPSLLNSLPHVSRWAMFFFLMIMPFSFLYVRATLGKSGLGWKDLWVLAPALLYFCDYLPFFLKSGAEKLSIMHTISAQNLSVSYNEGWLFPSFTWRWMSDLVCLGFWIAQGVQIMQRFRDNSVGHRATPVQRRWLLGLQVSQLFIFLPPILLYLLGQSDATIVASNISALAVSGVQGYFLLFHPELLYGSSWSEPSQEFSIEYGRPGKETAIENWIDEDLDRKNAMPSYVEQLDAVTQEAIGQTLKQTLEAGKIYLKPDLRIPELATITGYSPHKLSAFFSRCETTFPDYINRLRVADSVEKLQAGEAKTKTFEAIARESGFQSRSTFIRAFKKFEGLTPSEFVERKGA